MKLKTTAIASIFITACAFTGTANANQAQIESLVANMVKSTLVEVSAEVKRDIKTTLYAYSHESLTRDNAEAPVGNVKITDIVVKADSETNAENKTESVNQKTEADD
ncbi:hypothetical protein [Glaciecola sp. 1036]|uniref:hypothetical protein n=1 Tax=Alteromonadaceae TaxID=72275 RepID=UPI003CFFEDC7